VKFPIYTSKWCRERQASINSSIVFAVLSLANIHLLIFVEGDDENLSQFNDLNSTRSTVNPFQYQRCYLHRNYVYFFEYIYTWIDMFLVTIIPFIFIILCNLTVINRVFLVSAPGKKNEIVSRSKATNRLRSLCLMMICSSFVFVATTLPVTAFIIDLLSNKVSIAIMRCRRVQWTIYNILMYSNYASILSYCLSGTEFRHVLMKTVRFRTKPSLATMVHTDMINAANQRRASTQFRRVLVGYQNGEHLRSSSMNRSTVDTNKKDQHLLKTTPMNSKYLQIQQPNYHDHYRLSCTSQTNGGGVTTSSSILPSPGNTRRKSSSASNNHNDIFDRTNDEKPAAPTESVFLDLVQQKLSLNPNG
jgi:hypothetical protein